MNIARNNKAFKAITSMIMVYVLMCSVTIVAYAAGVNDKFTSSSSSSSLYSLISNTISTADSSDSTSVNLLDEMFDAFAGADDSASSGSSTLVSYTWTRDGQTVTKYFTNTTLSGSTADSNYVTLYNSVKSSADNAGVKTKDNTVSKVQGDLDLIAEIANPAVDLIAGKNVLQPFVPGIGKMAGVVINASLLFLGLGTALDVFFLITPPFQRKCNDVGQQGGKMSGRVKETGESKFRLISDDAILAQEKAQEDGSHPVWVYGGRRWKTYVCVVLVIVLLLTQSMTSLISVVLTLLGGVISEITNTFQSA